MEEVRQNIISFLELLKSSEEIELYNEAGLQHEFAIYLKTKLGKKYRIQLERNVDLILGHKQFTKKEMDIYILDRENDKKYCIELKVPTSHQVPRRMQLSFLDVKFLEELKSVGFSACYLLFTSPNKSFWKATRSKENIYQLFNEPIVEFKSLNKGDVPNFIKDEASGDVIVELQSNHKAEWHDLKLQGDILWRYFLLEI